MKRLQLDHEQKPECKFVSHALLAGGGLYFSRSILLTVSGNMGHPCSAMGEGGCDKAWKTIRKGLTVG